MLCNGENLCGEEEKGEGGIYCCAVMCRDCGVNVVVYVLVLFGSAWTKIPTEDVLGL